MAQAQVFELAQTALPCSVQVTLTFLEGDHLEYKIARGSWDSVEKGPACEEIPNRY